MKSILNQVLEQKQLSKQQAHETLLQIASGKLNASQMAAFITVFMMRTITVEELAGFRDAMLDLCLRVELDQPVIDVCGTGGDGKNTFNISTLASFVVAACGQPVAKHGNYGVSSVSGSSNMLEHFGYVFTNNIDVLKRQIEEVNIAFMHAPLFHPAMKTVAPIRKELGVKTFFNMLGPMVNPALPPNQMVGVFSLELARQYAYLYQQTDKRFSVLHCLGGYDEISLTDAVKVFDNKGESVLESSYYNSTLLHPDEIKGGETVTDAATIFLNVLEGKGTVQQNAVVVANAAQALITCQPTLSINDAIEQAREALLSGEAYKRFKKLLNIQP